MPDPKSLSAENMARVFHENYERLAPRFGYRTRKSTAVPWDKVPFKNKALMVAVCRRVLAWIARMAVSASRPSSGSSVDSPSDPAVGSGPDREDGAS